MNKPSKECENALERLEEKFEQVVKKCAKVFAIVSYNSCTEVTPVI